MAVIWKTLKIFVSSTFLDLELARDRLSGIFRNLEKQTYARQLTIKPYDLRWQDRHLEDALVEWCLDMVKECQYFVGILGTRYGWRPPVLPSGQENIEGISITEMEFAKAQETIAPQRRFFCVAQDFSSQGDLREREALERLKQRLQNEGETVLVYHNVAELMDIVKNQLQQMIDRDYPPGSKVEPVTYTRYEAQQELREEKFKNFVGRTEELANLQSFVSSDELPNYLAIRGVAGTGKSSLLAQMVEHCQQQQIPVISHFLGADLQAASLSEILLGLLEQLQSLKLLQEPLASQTQELQTQLHNALANSSQQLVVVIDGLDEAIGSAQNLRWLARNLPGNVRLLLSARPGEMYQKLLQFSQLQSWELAPLKAVEIQELLEVCCQEHAIALTPEQQQLISKRSEGNPLFLKVALDEMAASGIAVGQLAVSVHALFEQILDRLANKYGTELLETYLGAIAASRSGVLEKEMRDILQIPDETLLELGRALSHFILPRRGLLNFFHAEFARTIKMRLGKGAMRHYHQQLAHYYQQQGTGYPRTLQELPYQLQWAEEYSKLLSYLTDIEFLTSKAQAGLLLDLKEDLEFALMGQAVKLPENLQLANGLTPLHLKWLHKALDHDFRFLQAHPQCLFPYLWNLLYWHDHPQAHEHYPGQKWPEPTTQMHLLVEGWRKSPHVPQVWLKSFRPLPQRLDSPLQKILRGHSQAVESIAFSPEGDKIASASWDRTVRIWDTQNGELLQILAGHQDMVFSVTFHPQNPWVASASRDKTVKIWDVTSGEQLRSWQAHDKSIHSVHFSPNGKWLACASQDTTIKIWDLANAQLIQQLIGHNKTVLAIKFGPDSQYLVSGSLDRTVRLWHLKQSQPLQVFNDHQSSVESVDFASNGKYVAAASFDKTARVWDITSNQQIWCFSQHQDRTYSVAFSPDSQKLATGSLDKTIRIFDLNNGQLTQSLLGHENNVICLRFAQDGKQIASAGGGDRSVRLWSIDSHHTSPTLPGHQAKVTTIDFNPSGTLLASAARDHQIILWQVPAAQPTLLGNHDHWVSCVRFITDNQLLSCSHDHKIILWDTAKRTVSKVFREHSRQVICLDISSCGQYFVSGSSDSTMKLWSPHREQSLRTFAGHKYAVAAVAYSPDGKKIASYGKDDLIRIWEVANAQEIAQLKCHKVVENLAFTRDSQAVVFSSLDYIVREWNWQAGKTHKIMSGLAESRSLTTSSEKKPYQVITTDWQTIVQRKDTGSEQTYFPGVLKGAIFSPEKTLAAYSGNHVYLMQLVD